MNTQLKNLSTNNIIASYVLLHPISYLFFADIQYHEFCVYLFLAFKIMC